MDPKALEQMNLSPYLSMNGNPVLLNDVMGDRPPDEFEIDVKTGQKTKLSNLGGEEIDFNHYKGGDHDGDTEIINKETGDKIWMTDGAKFIKDYAQRSNNTNWANLFSEFISGKGPEKSLMYGTNQIMNNEIMKSFAYARALTTFATSGKDKLQVKQWFGPLGAVEAGNNISAQFLGKANYNFYHVGDKLVSIIIDSKSKTSWSINPFAKDEGNNFPRESGKITPQGNTHQTYIFVLPYKQ